MNNTPDILQRIVRRKREEIEERSNRLPLNQLSRELEAASPARGFVDAIASRLQTGKPAVIAEIKRASPSKGIIREDFRPADIAVSYHRGGAACLSVLTDEQYFQGSDDYLREARGACALPVLRKDFLVDPWQLFESRLLGADCVLLIVAALSRGQLQDLDGLAREAGLAYACLAAVVNFAAGDSEDIHGELAEHVEAAMESVRALLEHLLPMAQGGRGD